MTRKPKKSRGRSDGNDDNSSIQSAKRPKLQATSPTSTRSPVSVPESRYRVDRTEITPRGKGFPKSTWIRATEPDERHYLIQNRSCNNLKPNSGDHWEPNGPIWKCTTCTAKTVGGGGCRFLGLRAFAAIPEGRMIRNFEFDDNGPRYTTTTSVIAGAQRPKKVKNTSNHVSPVLLGFKRTEQPDFSDWVLCGLGQEAPLVSKCGLSPYLHGVSSVAERFENTARAALTAENSQEVSSSQKFKLVDKPNFFAAQIHQRAFDTLQYTAGTLHKILSRAALYFAVDKCKAQGSEIPVAFKSPEPNERVICDSCGTTCFLGSFMCTICGRERCLQCWESWTPNGSDTKHPDLFIPRLDRCANRKRHAREHFYVINRSNVVEVNWLLHRTSPQIWARGLEIGSYPNHHHTISAEPKSYPEDLLNLKTENIILLAQSCSPRSKAQLRLNHEPSTDEERDKKQWALLRNSRELLPTFDAENLKPKQLPHLETVFRSLWHFGGDRVRGIPIVIEGMLNRFQESWNPQYFINNHGREQCWVVDCSTNETLAGGAIVTVGEFFESFATHNFRGKTASMKLKDWPPNEDFADNFPTLFRDFENALPFPEHMTRTGACNLVSYLPTKGVLKPDLGPKMYCAYPAPEYFTGFEGEEKGSTRLHMDVTCAINIMVYAAEAHETSETSSYPGAIWDIFEPQDTNTLNKYLRQKYSHLEVDDPINRQLFFLSNDDLAILNTEDWGYTKAFRVLQEPGDAVLIPAGCAHQVANCKSCIKVAVDFITAERVDVCVDVMEMFRDLAAQYKYLNESANTSSLAKANDSKQKSVRSNSTKVTLPMKEDILQLYNCLYFTWFQIRGLALSLELGEYGNPSKSVNMLLEGSLIYRDPANRKGLLMEEKHAHGDPIEQGIVERERPTLDGELGREERFAAAHISCPEEKPAQEVKLAFKEVYIPIGTLCHDEHSTRDAESPLEKEPFAAITDVSRESPSRYGDSGKTTLTVEIETVYPTP